MFKLSLLLTLLWVPFYSRTKTKIFSRKDPVLQPAHVNVTTSLLHYYPQKCLNPRWVGCCNQCSSTAVTYCKAAVHWTPKDCSSCVGEFTGANDACLKCMWVRAIAWKEAFILKWAPHCCVIVLPPLTTDSAGSSAVHPQLSSLNKSQRWTWCKSVQRCSEEQRPSCRTYMCFRRALQ